MTTENYDDTTSDSPSPSSRSRRIVIAEDHAEQVEALCALLAKLRPAWQVCAAVGTPAELLLAIEEHVPELLLLDVHLVDGTSLDALLRLPYRIPIVFISGDPAFAIDAYEHAAVDYLLKPIRPARLERALSRVDELDAPLSRAAEVTRWFTARRGETSTIVHVDDVIYLQAQTKYTRVVMRDGEVLLRRGLGIVEKQLDPENFVRIHRSTVVNIAHAGTLQRDDLGRLKLQMRGRSEWLFVSKPFERVFKVG